MIKNKSYFLFPHYNEYSEKTVPLKCVGKVVLRCSGDDFALFLYLSFSVLLAVVSHASCFASFCAAFGCPVSSDGLPGAA